MIKPVTLSFAAAGLAGLLCACFAAPGGESTAAAESRGGPAVAMAAADPPAQEPPVPAKSPPAAPVVAAAAAAPSSPKDMVAAECGACHMPYPAMLLPARSWQAIMSGLTDHFGENASLDAATAQEIGDYLVANAADAGNRRSPVVRGLTANDVPLRITDTPWWKRQHSEVSAAAFKRASVKSAGNCVVCHGPGAVRGVFEDD